MGVYRVTSPAAQAYAAREKVLGSGITILGSASEKIASLDKITLEKCGDIAAELLPHAPGYAGKLLHVSARLFWALARVKEKETKVIPLEELEKKIEELKTLLG
ncbi:MAG: hypothetical protein HY929_04030 [Euryarchaeota archaeon]|nr:hypothetical protein [Euryarchaeota archaeon]